jgi:hypothetical protein
MNSAPQSLPRDSAIQLIVLIAAGVAGALSPVASKGATVAGSFGTYNGSSGPEEFFTLFDPSLGTLTGATATISLRGSEYAQIANSTTSTQFGVSVNSTATLILQDGANQLVDSTFAISTGSIVVGPGSLGAFLGSAPGLSVNDNLTNFYSVATLTATASSPQLGGSAIYWLSSPPSETYGATTLSGPSGVSLSSVSPNFLPVSGSITYTYTPSSTGGGGTPPVPLPAAAWLMLSGLGGLGALARRNRTKPQSIV